MHPFPMRLGAICLASTLALAPTTSDAIAPALLLVIKQIAKQTATSMIKDAMLSTLSGMGCKGIALSNALSAMDLRGGGLPRLPAGMTMPNMPNMPNMPPGMAMPNMPNLPPGMAMPNMPNLPPGMVMPNMPGMTGMPGVAGLPGGMPAEMAAKMQQMMPGVGALPPTGIDPDMMARVQQAMSQPLSPPETLATIDELFELGFMPKAIQGEFKECMVLVPSTIAPLGMAMGMLKPMIPQLRQAREQMHALSPAEQDEAVAALVLELRPLPADQRATMLEHLDSGFFPKRMADGIRAQLQAK